MKIKDSKNILVTGSLAFDYIMDFPQSFEENILPDKLKTLSVSFLAQNFSKNNGGVAGNIAYNLGLLNLNPIILASWGNDSKEYKKHLEKVGVNTQFVNKVNDFTANMFMITDKNNCQIAGFYPGAMVKDEDLSIVQSVASETSLIVVSPTVPKAMDNFVNQAKKLKISYLYDPAQQIPRISSIELKNGIEGAEILIGNDYELALIMKKTGFSKEEILKKAKILITTFGEKGSLIEKWNEHVQIGIAKPDKITDPTGAGDAYIAGFLYGYINSLNLVQCGQLGAALASFAIEQYGTQRHNSGLDMIKKRFKEAFGSTLDMKF